MTLDRARRRRSVPSIRSGNAVGYLGNAADIRERRSAPVELRKMQTKSGAKVAYCFSEKRFAH